MKKVLKSAVWGVERVLPAPAFESMYRWAFPKYKALIRFGYICYGALFYSWWNGPKWAMMREVYRIMPYTLVGIGGLEASYRLTRRASDLDLAGDVVELGVARGGCAALLGSAIFDEREPAEVKKRDLWLFDSYEGLPDPTKEDFLDGAESRGTGDHVRPLPKGSCLGTLDEVQELLLRRRGFPEDRIHFVKGWFQDTVPVTGQTIQEIAVLRIDGDWYESTKVCLEGLFDKVVANGAVIIDDYQSCYGCERAVDEFLDERNLDVEIHLDGRGGCYFLKP